MTNKQKGFTLIELLLAMAFISFMLFFITNAILQATRLYVKGSAIRQINQTGRQVISDLSSTIRYSKAPVYVPANNRLCVGGTSYAWNVENVPAVNVYANPNAAIPLRFISVQDQPALLCSNPTSAIDQTVAKNLLGNETTLLQFSITNTGALWDLSLVLSAAGSNKAGPDASTPTGFSCAQDNQFCAFGDFTTTIYSRTRGN